jgi:hypothetical protein
MIPTFSDFHHRGEWTEMLFAAQATAHGFTVTKPWGERTRYDFVLEYQGGFLRIQVKSTSNKVWSGTYLVDCRPNRTRPRKFQYRPDEIDFVAVYVVPADAWYLIPVGELLKRKSYLRLDPFHLARTCTLEQYREAWPQLRRAARRRRSRTVYLRDLRT